MSVDPFDAFFRELCAMQGFCSLGVDGEDSIRNLWPASAEEMARAVFAAEGLDYETYEPAAVKAGVAACITRHLGGFP